MKINIIFDIDGVIVDNSSHGDYVINNVFDNEAFSKAIPFMNPNDWAVSMLKSLKEDFHIILVTAREKQHKNITLAWLKKNNVFYDDIIFINSYVNDEYVVKYKIITANRFNPLFIVEDNKQNVIGLRKAGYTVLQPNFIYYRLSGK